MGFGSSRVAKNHSASLRAGRSPGALDITCGSPCGNITMSPSSSRTGGSPTIAAQPLPFVTT